MSEASKQNFPDKFDHISAVDEAIFALSFMATDDRLALSDEARKSISDVSNRLKIARAYFRAISVKEAA
jgi:hypothetical protein